MAERRKPVAPTHWHGRIIECIRATPGALYSQLHYAATSGRAGTGVGRLIKQMEHRGEIHAVIDGQKRRFYLPDQSAERGHPLDALWAARDALIPDAPTKSRRHKMPEDIRRSIDPPRRREHGIQSSAAGLYL